MFLTAFNEIRFRPGRIIATVIAIAISVAFMAGVSVFSYTVSNSISNSLNRSFTKADLVIETSQQMKKVAQLAKKSPGVVDTDLALESIKKFSAAKEDVFIQIYNVPKPDFAWAKLIAGRWAKTPSEIVLAKDAAHRLKLTVGDQISSGNEKYTITGISNDPPNLFAELGYMALVQQNQRSGDFVIVKTTPNANLNQIKNSLQQTVRQVDDKAVVKIAAKQREINTKAALTQFSGIKIFLQVFAAIALIVGMVIIANTFNILLVQRRRQIGLQRAVGASGAQVRRQFLVEAALIGMIGSVLGIGLGIGAAAIGAAILNTLIWGLSIPWGELGIVFGLGVLATVLSAVLPSRKATRVSPIEALQVVPTAGQAKRATVMRYVVCSIFALVGVSLTVIAINGKGPVALLWGILSGFALTIAILAAAQIYVPSMVKGFGKMFSFLGSTFKLAAQNAARNPRRVAATATALMLAVGLTLTMQIASASMRVTLIKAVETKFPVDITIEKYDGVIPEDVVNKVRNLTGVSVVRQIPGLRISNNEYSYAVAPGKAMYDIAPNAEVTPPNGQTVLIDPERYSQNKTEQTIQLSGSKGKVTLTAKPSRFAGNGKVIISLDNLEKLGKPQVSQLWLKLSDRKQAATLIRQFNTIVPQNQYIVNGTAVQANAIESLLNMLALIMTALLGVAVLIALIGVANTLSLSMLERKRETALLRALGMQRSSLRLMLLYEAGLIGLVGVIVGSLAGMYFGWLGVTTGYKLLPTLANLKVLYAIDIKWTILVVGIVILAALLASVLPGRRAAHTAPTEVLAEE